MDGKGIDSPRRRTIVKAAAAAAVAMVPVSIYSGSGWAAEPSLRIGVIGSGRMGSTLGEIWIRAGHDIMFASLDIEHDKALAAKLGPKARAGSSRDAAAFGEVIFIAVPYSAMRAVAGEIGDQIKGKIVIDASNPIATRDGEIAAWAREQGAGLATAQIISGARIVRGFNAIGFARLPGIAARKGEPVGMPIAGDDGAALTTASRLVRDAGLEPVVVGGLTMGRHLLPGTPLAGEKTPEQIRQIAATLK